MARGRLLKVLLFTGVMLFGRLAMAQKASLSDIQITGKVFEKIGLSESTANFPLRQIKAYHLGNGLPSITLDFRDTGSAYLSVDYYGGEYASAVLSSNQDVFSFYRSSKPQHQLDSAVVVEANRIQRAFTKMIQAARLDELLPGYEIVSFSPARDDSPQQWELKHLETQNYFTAKRDSDKFVFSYYGVGAAPEHEGMKDGTLSSRLFELQYKLLDFYNNPYKPAQLQLRHGG